MVDEGAAKLLEQKVIERINKQYPTEKADLSNTIALIAAQVAIITLQEYEKLSNSQK